MQQLRCPGTITGVDAASCYDRIVHSIAILITRHEGLSLLPLLALFGVIQQMRYFVRTGYGESESIYGGENINNIPRYMSRKWSKSNILANHYNDYGPGDA